MAAATAGTIFEFIMATVTSPPDQMSAKRIQAITFTDPGLNMNFVTHSAAKAPGLPYTSELLMQSIERKLYLFIVWE